MFAYCNNTPINGSDPSGHFFIELLREWLYGTGQEVAMADGPAPVGDAVFVVGLGALGFLSLLELGYNTISSSGSTTTVDGVTGASAVAPKPKSISGSTPASPPDPYGNKGKKNQNSDIQTPDVKYPGNDPAQSPGENYKWRGPDPQGGKRGGYVNVDGSDSWHPDLDHPDGVGPHWDYNDPFGHKWRVYPDWIEFVH